MAETIVLILLVLFALGAALVFGVDFLFYLKDRYCRFHIGRWPDPAAWQRKVEDRAVRWLRHTPTVKITDNCRYMLLDFLTGRYRSHTIQSWQKGALLLAMLESGRPELARRAKCMVVSYPANPVGVAAPDSFYEELIAFARRYEILIIHDNAYSEIVYDGRQGKSFLSYPGAKEVGVEFNSLSKTYNLTGARISFVLGNREIVSAFRRLRSQIDYGIFLPVQHAAIAALNGPQDSVARNRAEYQARRDALCGGLRSVGWDVPDSQGSMFVWAPLPCGRTNSVDFCFELLQRTGLLCTPGAAFGELGEGHVRFALVRPVPDMEEIVREVDRSGILRGGSR